ncbi:hypothetical protein B0J18DRAFT_143314 [Chaetomium sp. MPI-SDFR-AT-0129]|nr:hypothetical protein B0J18DRAFT_143314 [Chaetomium sp. MPI-SDFR-AT-0129]
MHTIAALRLFAVTAAASPARFGRGECAETIERDVAVIGGGASGAHAAVWLRDAGYSVVVVERAAQLGGHTNFYTDPASGTSINVGVQGWVEYNSAFDFPHRMNVSTSGAMSFTPNTVQYIDYETGHPVAGYTAPDQADMNAALQRYLDALEQYQDLVLPGFFNFPSDPASIPEDLLIPFGEFAEKYNLSAALPQIWDATAQGLGDTMHVPTLWVVQACGAPFVRALLGTAASAVPDSGRLYDLYDSVAAFLGSDVLYSSAVISTTRSDDDDDTTNPISLKVLTTNDNKHTCIHARRLLLSMEPTPSNTSPFDLDSSETAILARFNYSTVYAGVLRHPSLQTLNAYTNRSPAPGSLTYTVFPVAPQVGRIEYVGGTEDIFALTAVGTAEDTAEGMKRRVNDAIEAMIEAGTLPPPPDGDDRKRMVEVDFELFADHGHMHSRVSAEELRAGFITDLYSLQGRRNTFWTGAAFSAGFSTVVWEFNKVLLPKVIEGL